MSDNIINFNEEAIYTELKNLIRTSVEEALNAMLDTVNNSGYISISLKNLPSFVFPT